MTKYGQGHPLHLAQGKYTMMFKGQIGGQRPLPSQLLQSRRGWCGRQGAPSRSEFQGRLSPEVSGLPFQLHCALTKQTRECKIKYPLWVEQVKIVHHLCTFCHRGPSRLSMQELQPLQLSLSLLQILSPPPFCLRPHCCQQHWMAQIGLIKKI